MNRNILNLSERKSPELFEGDERRKTVIYADNAATTKMSEAAINTMLNVMKESYGNPSSLYGIGQHAKEVLE